jgi:hypothetical protein
MQYQALVQNLVANPWLETHGVLRDDTTFDDWVEEIAKYRREVDGEDSDRLLV